MLKMILQASRRGLAKAPRLRRIAVSLYVRGTAYAWRARNVITRNRPVRVQVGDGHVVMISEGHIAEVLWHARFEEHERRMVAAILQPGMTVFNVGANAGLYALIAARRVSPTGEVHAFEAAGLNHRR